MKFNPDIPVYGDVDFRGKCPTESAEQITFFNKIRKVEPCATHIRNEGKKTYQQVARQKAEGMTKGASDIIIPGSPAFVCELKRKDHTKSRWQDGQIEYLLNAKKNGAFVCVALGWQSAMQAYKEWRAIVDGRIKTG